MKKTISIFFLLVYLFSVTEISQLFKLPVVFEHYAEHKKVEPQISFIQFLEMHYMHGNPKDKDYERDMQLPFKNSTAIVSIVSNDCLPLVGSMSLPKPVAIPLKKSPITADIFTPSPCLSNIWQPPKTC